MRTDLQNMIIGNLSTQQALINNLVEVENQLNEWKVRCNSIDKQLTEVKQDLDAALIECRKHRTDSEIHKEQIEYYKSFCRTKDSVIEKLKHKIARLERRSKKKH